MAKWKEILSDSSKYPDDFTVALKDGQTMTLADMRSYDREHEGELTQRLTAKEQEVVRREGVLNSASVNLAQLMQKLEEKTGLTMDELIDGKVPTKRVVAQSAELDENDPLVGTLVKEIKSVRAELAATRDEIGTVKKNALGPMLNTYLDDFYESKWEKITPSLPKGAKVERQQALEYAQKNGLKDAKGRFDLDKAARDLTFDARVDELAEKKADGLRKKMEDERVLANAPKPSGTRISVKTDKSLTNDKGQTKNFDEVLNDAMQDTDLWRNVQVQ